jgi:glutathione S-transferase
VPTLVHDGEIICDSTIICEYLEDISSNHPLRPSDPLERTRVLYWTKAVDEELHPACGFVTFLCSHRHIVWRLGDKSVKNFLDSTPALSVTANWHETKKDIVMNGFDAVGAESKLKLYDLYLHKMEKTLATHTWLAGDNFTLADIALTPYVNRLDMMSMSPMWENGRLPGVAEWFDRIKLRPSFVPAVLEWVPEELTQDMKIFGAKSWPEAAKLLSIDTTN